jgi:hypothetical protein
MRGALQLLCCNKSDRFVIFLLLVLSLQILCYFCSIASIFCIVPPSGDALCIFVGKSAERKLGGGSS